MLKILKVFPEQWQNFFEGLKDNKEKVINKVKWSKLVTKKKKKKLPQIRKT